MTIAYYLYIGVIGVLSGLGLGAGFLLWLSRPKTNPRAVAIVGFVTAILWVASMAFMGDVMKGHWFLKEVIK